MIFVFDLDKTLWESDLVGNFGSLGKMVYEIKGYKVDIMMAINDLYDKGHTIIMQTARHWDKYNETVQQLEGFKYHTLVMGNIPADMYVNDKGETPEGFLKFYEANFKNTKTGGC